MLAADLTNTVHPYAIWFATSGVLATLTAMLAQTDTAVRHASETDRKLTLARLNEHLSTTARVASTILVGEAVVYHTIRTPADFQNLRELVLRHHRATLWVGVTKRLTRSAVLAVLFHVAGGLTIVSLALKDVVPADASHTSSLVPWIALTGIAITMLAGKTVIYLLRGD